MGKQYRCRSQPFTNGQIPLVVGSVEQGCSAVLVAQAGMLNGLTL